MPQRLLVETGFGRDTHEIFLGAAKSRQNPPTRASRGVLLRLVRVREPEDFSGSRQNPPKAAIASDAVALIETGMLDFGPCCSARKKMRGREGVRSRSQATPCVGLAGSVGKSESL